MMSKWEKAGYVFFFIIMPLLVASSPLLVQEISYLVSLTAAMLLIYLGVLAYVLDTRMRVLKSLIHRHAVVDPIYEIDFYDRFAVSVRSAIRRVDISYLHNKSPYSSQDSRKRGYYDEMVNIIKKRKAVNYKRLIRAVPDNVNWIDKMMKDFKGVANFSLACILDQCPEEESVEAVSVQLIDDNVTYLVSVGEQKQRRDPRDVYVESEEFNVLWTRYYQRLWEKSELIIDEGNINKKNFRNVQSHIEGISKKSG